MTVDYEAQRERFPSLRDRTYLVTHSFGLPPQEMFDDLDAYRETLRRRPLLFDEWLERREEMYRLVERLLGAPAGTVALRESATACHATILAALEPSGRRRRLLGSAHQFPSVGYTLAAQARRGFDVTIVPARSSTFDADEIVAELDDTVAAVFVPIVASFNGALLDVARVAKAAEAVGTILVVDGYTGLGVVPLDVATLPPCVVVGGTIKWLGGGGTGLAFMYVHDSLLERLPVAYPGWLGDARFIEFEPAFVPAIGAQRYQLGTPAIEPIYSARAGLRFVLEHGLADLSARNRHLLDRIAARAITMGLRLNSPSRSERRAGIIAIEVTNPTRVVEALRTQGVDIDARGTNSVRLGPHWCVLENECDRAVDLIADVASV